MSSKQDIYSYLFEIPRHDFAHHLSLEDNHRILFSGMYGMGKTTFINHFFDEDIQHQFLGRKKYNVIHLYPVNYTISTTEDIFRYIKIDILKVLLKHYPHIIDDTTFSFSTFASYFIANKLGHLVPSLFMLLGQVGETDLLDDFGAPEGVSKATGVFSPLYELINKIKSKYEEVENWSNDLKKINEIIENETHKEGSLYEINFITRLIIDLVSRLQNEFESNEESVEENQRIDTVLIIDDLDRLDPSHVFRLFNVFAAHLNDAEGIHNKFGFNRVIFVCDINNIRRLFAHFYGASTSFSGYIDKFYSNAIFNFDNTESICGMINSILSQIQFYYDDGKEQSFVNKLVQRNLSNILPAFLYNGNISLRTLLKLQKPVKIINKYLSLGLPNDQSVHVAPFVEISVLIKLLGSKEEVIAAFDRAKVVSNIAPERKITNSAYINIARSCLQVIGVNHNDSQTLSIYSRNEVFLAMKIDGRSNEGDVFVSKSDRINYHSKDTQLDIDPAELYLRTISSLSAKNLL